MIATISRALSWMPSLEDRKRGNIQSQVLWAVSGNTILIYIDKPQEAEETVDLLAV